MFTQFKRLQVDKAGNTLVSIIVSARLITPDGKVFTLTIHP